MCIGGNSIPKAVSVPVAVPSPTDSRVLDAADAEAARRRQGIAATILTSPAGVLDAAPIGAKTLTGQ